MFRVKALRVSGLGIGSRVLGPKSRSLEPHVVLGDVSSGVTALRLGFGIDRRCSNADLGPGLEASVWCRGSVEPAFRGERPRTTECRDATFRHHSSTCCIPGWQSDSWLV